MPEKLAIIIPAYKAEFLTQTLDSISKQTCKDFTVYICNDDSREDLYSIVKNYESDFKTVYKKFESNLGGTDLVKHWERCISISADEEWIWLFSDDDVMEENCVQKFYDYIKVKTQAELLHFDVDVIDQHGNLYEPGEPFPSQLSSYDFFTERVNFALHSYVVEYIFKRELFLKKGGFVKFDLAWCSDDATWIKLAFETGISTISGAKIKWRYSTSNISSQTSNKPIILRKLRSSIAYINWVDDFFEKGGVADQNSTIQKLRWIFASINNAKGFSINDKLEFNKIILKELFTRKPHGIVVNTLSYLNVFKYHLKSYL